MEQEVAVERRTHPRSVLPSGAVGVRVVFPDGRNVSGVVKDLSAGGVFVVADATGCQVGDTVSVMFEPAIGVPYARKCQVKHVQPDGFGAMFAK